MTTSFPVRSVAALSFLAVLGTGVGAAPDCTGCTAGFEPRISIAVDGYSTSVSLNGTLPDMAGACEAPEGDCDQSEPCRIQVTVAWTVPPGGACKDGKWCRSRVAPPGGNRRCTDTGSYCSSGSNGHEETVSCGFAYFVEAWLGDSVSTFVASCTDCIGD